MSTELAMKTEKLWWDRQNELKDPYGFIYVTTNLINGKKYIGQKKFNQYTWKNYLGSGVGITRAIKKYGKENFKREIVSIASYESELNRLEIEWIKLHDAVKNDDDYYNQIPGGNFYRDRNKNRKNEKIIEEFFIYTPSIEHYDWELMKESDPNLSDQ